MKKKLFILLLGFGIVLLGWTVLRLKNKNNETIFDTKVIRGNMSVTILATGTVQPENRLEIKPPVAGRIERVLVEEGSKVKKGQVLAWMSSTERAALIDSIRSQGAEELKKWEEIYKPTPIIAPLQGTIIKKNIEAGQTFSTNEAVLVMSNRLTIKAQVDETDLAQIKKDQLCEVRLDSYPEEKIDAKVERIAFEAKTVNNVTTYTIDVLPQVTPEFMRSGMTANIIFFVENRENILMIPTEYIQFENGIANVMIKDNQQQLQKAEIKLGTTEGKFTEILAGLQEGANIYKKVLSQEDKKTNPFMPMGNRNKKNGNKSNSSRPPSGH